MSVDDSFRRAHLTWALQHVLAHTGGRVQVAGAYDAIVIGPGPNHLIHLVVSILTAGLWLPLWLLILLTSKPTVYAIAVDPAGVLSVYNTTERRPMHLSREGRLSYV